MPSPIAIMWFRRDLRLNDNTALAAALQSGYTVLPIFVFDREILDKLPSKADRRVQFIHDALAHMQVQLVGFGSSLWVHYGTPESAFEALTNQFEVKAVYTNHDYEPYAKQRDTAIGGWLSAQEIDFHTFKDQVIFEKKEVTKDDGLPYTVFTPYSKKWKAKLVPERDFAEQQTEPYFGQFLQLPVREIPSLESMGFVREDGVDFPSAKADHSLIKAYAQQRDLPGLRGTSRLGVHLRFGTISIRQLAWEAYPLSETFINELIWRDFYHMILWNFPHVGEGKAFRKEYDAIRWRDSEADYEAWKNGQTGYPIVDAGMRELNETGFMHNRVRMIVASFLTKHLLLDWRLGEAYFAEKLLDFDLAANNGGWQWAAGSGCDAAPYFRVFNPRLQTEKFDKQLVYIRKWVPELNSFSYPKPIVDHDFARKRCLEVYAAALKPAQ